MRSDTSFSIRLKVLIALAFFNKVEIEIPEREYCYHMEKELRKWANDKQIKFSVKDTEKPCYIVGHEVYKMGNERYKTLSFSK